MIHQSVHVHKPAKFIEESSDSKQILKLQDARICLLDLQPSLKDLEISF